MRLRRTEPNLVLQIIFLAVDYICLCVANIITIYQPSDVIAMKSLCNLLMIEVSEWVMFVFLIAATTLPWMQCAHYACPITLNNRSRSTFFFCLITAFLQFRVSSSRCLVSFDDENWVSAMQRCKMWSADWSKSSYHNNWLKQVGGCLFVDGYIMMTVGSAKRNAKQCAVWCWLQVLVGGLLLFFTSSLGAKFHWRKCFQYRTEMSYRRENK